MLQEEEVSTRHAAIKETAEKIIQAIQRKLEVFLYDSEDTEIQKISQELIYAQRVKSSSSVFRKCGEIGVESITSIPSAIEDFIGIRITTKNKAIARALSEDLQKRYNNGNWFTKWYGQVTFDSKTMANGKKYAFESGYQAFHINFIHDSENRYLGECDVSKWPVEIQIMSQLWAFYAEFSRRYFYKPEDPAPEHLSPYIMPLAKILDSADELVTSILHAKKQYEIKEQEDIEESRNEISSLTQWLSQNDNLMNLFGAPRMPSDSFLLKIYDLIKKYNYNYEDIIRIMQNPEYIENYLDIIAASPGIYYLPIYQRLLLFILMEEGVPETDIITSVNQELWHKHLTLKKPPKRVQKGYVLTYNENNGTGLVTNESLEVIYSFKENNLEPPLTTDILKELDSNETLIEFHLQRVESSVGVYFEVKSMVIPE